MTVSIVSPEAIVAVLYGMGSFMVGVGWAAYRAVGWVERMRTWAHTTPINQEEVS